VRALVIVAWMSYCLAGRADEITPAAWWRLDQVTSDGRSVFEKRGQVWDQIDGYFRIVEGADGNCLKFDGFTARLTRKAGQAPQTTNALTVDAWIAPQEYSWNWTAIVNQNKAREAGYFFGINHVGQIGLQVAVNGKWQGVASTERVALLKWSHVAGVFDSKSGLTVYVNGKPAGTTPIQGKMTPAGGTDLLIGMSHARMYPAMTERKPSKGFLSKMIFDGLIDEVRIWDRVLSAEQINRLFNAVKPRVAQPLKYRVMPSGPKGPGRFGAYYTRLKYCQEWDRIWRVGDHADVLVRFDESPVRMVFWRGTGYVPAWVTENGLWASDQGPESWNRWGCCEHMSDKHCRYSHVRVIENNDARVVIHWRTALADITYGFNHVDEYTGRGEWADEYYTVYPDAVAVRHQTVHSNWSGHEFQQSEILNQPGSRPQDTVEMAALTLVNMKGETHTYSWAKGFPFKGRAPKPAGANIQVINFKAKNKHFVIGEPGAYWKCFGFGALEGYSTMACWNHWPVAQLPNDGRVTPAPDRPSSTCLGTLYPPVSKRDGIARTAVNLYGMTEKPASTLASLARSWNFPAELKLTGDDFVSEGYDKTQRAYVLQRKKSGKPPLIEFVLVAGEDSPAINPAFVINDWGDANAALSINGEVVKRGPRFRVGRRRRVDATDLIVWTRIESTGPVRISLSPISE